MVSRFPGGPVDDPVLWGAYGPDESIEFHADCAIGAEAPTLPPRRMASRDWPDGVWVHRMDEGITVRRRTELEVPVPSVRDAKGQNLVAQCLRRAGFDHRPAYHPERRGEQ